MSGETVFHNPPTPILKKGRWKPLKLLFFWLEVIYQAWDADETLRRELKVRRAVEYFWRTSRCFIWWWITMSNTWYYFSSKMIWQVDIKDAKMSSVLNLISKRFLNINFLCIFFMNYWWVWEEVLKPLWSEWWSHVLHFHLLKPIV